MSKRFGGSFGLGRITATGGTAFIQGIPPWAGQQGGSAPLLYGQAPGTNGAPNWMTINACVTRIRQVIYTTGATAHLIGLLRPFNFAYLTADAAASQAAVVLDYDPGLYTTKFRYPTANGAFPTTSTNAIAAGDYVAYQDRAGAWVFDTVASGSGTTPTLTTNLPTGGLVAGQPLFFFGIIGDTNPNTKMPNNQFSVAAASVEVPLLNAGADASVWNSFFPGDPLIFYSPNTTNQGWLENISGEYAMIG